MKIASYKSLGLRQTYSPEMSGQQHNYITDNSSAVHRNSHAVSYCLMAYRTLWLKAHFAPEYWASVMSTCHPDKLSRYIEVARAEAWRPSDITYSGNYCPAEAANKVVVGTVNINKMNSKYTVTGDVINQGLVGIKGLGKKASEKMSGDHSFNHIEEFVEKFKSKIVLERFIKLGAFKDIPGHNNSLALWCWYQYNHCSGPCELYINDFIETRSCNRECGYKCDEPSKSPTSTCPKCGKQLTIATKGKMDRTRYRDKLTKMLLTQQGWNEHAIKNEILRQKLEYKNLYPNRNVIPPKIINWKPKVYAGVDEFMKLLKSDYPHELLLYYEKSYLGYYIHSPLQKYIHNNYTVKRAKELKGQVELEGIVTEFTKATTKNGKDYFKITLSDGMQSVLVFMWSNEIDAHAKAYENKKWYEEFLNKGTGIQIMADYDEKRGTFTVARGEPIVRLRLK